MNNEQTSPKATGIVTQHALVVAWGIYAQEIGLIREIEQVKLKQKSRQHRPQTKVLEFLVALLAGLPHLKDISQAAHPLDQDSATALAWGQAGWADYSGVSRTLQRLTEVEEQALTAALAQISHPILTQEIGLALEKTGRLLYDADLTGRPIANSSTSYPGASFGYMGDTLSLGYQAALVSLHSPTYGRLWLVNRLQPGDTVSCTQPQALVQAAEAQTGLRPLRRTGLVSERLSQTEAGLHRAEAQASESQRQWQVAQDKSAATADSLGRWQQRVTTLAAVYPQTGRQPTAHCQLTRARQKVATLQKRLPRVQAQVERAQRRWQRHHQAVADLQTQVQQLRCHLAALTLDNQTNRHPIQAIFRLDSGFARRENLAWLIEMGYELYTKARSTKIRDLLTAAVTEQTSWQVVGGNAKLTAWPRTTVEGHLIYPMNVALAHYQTGENQQRAVLLHYGQEAVTTHLDDWFHHYNGRQTIEAGIKEGKGVFQMHPLKVRTTPALQLQEQFACFAANFVRWAAQWLTQQPCSPPAMITTSVKHLVQVSAHTSAWVCQQGDVWLLTFTDHSLYAGYSLRLGNGPVQLPLPLNPTIRF